MQFDIASMRTRFHELKARRDALRESAKPHRDRYDEKRNELADKERKELAPLTARMKEAEAPLADIENEMAVIARALNHQVGEG